MSIDIEERIKSNIIDNYDKALTNKIYLDNINHTTLELSLGSKRSLYIYGGNDTKIRINDKCNHIFLYNCNDMTLNISDCVSGITCINCNRCNLLCKRTPLYNIELSNSYDIDIVSMFFNMPIMYRCVRMNVVKSVNSIVQEYYKVNDGILTSWHCNYFNF